MTIEELEKWLQTRELKLTIRATKKYFIVSLGNEKVHTVSDENLQDAIRFVQGYFDVNVGGL